MNFMITLLGWFLWNWAEFSISKEEGDGSEYSPALLKLVNGTEGITDQIKAALISGVNAILKSPITLRAYAKTHYETWIGSLFCIPLLLWIGYKQLNIDPIANLLGASTSGWNDVYLIGAGAAWDAFMFLFKKAKSFFKKKTAEL